MEGQNLGEILVRLNQQHRSLRDYAMATLEIIKPFFSKLT